jgi:hypothetical protein
MDFRLPPALRVGLLLLLLGAAFSVHAVPQGTAITYQGELKQSGQPASGIFDFQIGLYLQASGGLAVDVLQLEDVQVTDGIFTLALDFTAAPFVGDQTWLEIGVRPGATTDGFTGLLPRQALTSVPYALNARAVEMDAINSAAIADSSVGSSEIIDNSSTALDLAANSVGASELADNAVDSAAIIDGAVARVDIADGSIDAAKLADASVGAAKIADASVGAAKIGCQCGCGEDCRQRSPAPGERQL